MSLSDFVNTYVEVNNCVFREFTPLPASECIIDPDRCFECGQPYRAKIATSTNTCLKCRIVQKVIYPAEDNQSDLLSQRNQKTPWFSETNLATAESGPPKKKQCRRNGPSSCNSSSSIPNVHSNVITPSDRRLAYRRYISQFAEDAEDIPEWVFNILYEDFNNIHMLNSLKCRPTSVHNTLKLYSADNENLLQYVSQSIRIARIFNAEPIPCFPLPLIEKMVQRFEDVSLCAGSIENFGKLPSFEMLTHMFLRAENRDDLAIIFFLNKASVLKTASTKLHQLILACAASDKTKASWENIPHAIG